MSAAQGVKARSARRRANLEEADTHLFQMSSESKEADK